MSVFIPCRKSWGRAWDNYKYKKKCLCLISRFIFSILFSNSLCWIVNFALAMKIISDTWIHPSFFHVSSSICGSYCEELGVAFIIVCRIFLRWSILCISGFPSSGRCIPHTGCISPHLWCPEVHRLLSEWRSWPTPPPRSLPWPAVKIARLKSTWPMLSEHLLCAHNCTPSGMESNISRTVPKTRCGKQMFSECQGAFSEKQSLPWMSRKDNSFFSPKNWSRLHNQARP